MTCLHCENENLRDYPLCDSCARVFHFPHRPVCLHCLATREAERLTEPMLRLVRQVAEINRCYGDEPVMRADMVDERIAAMAA